MWRVLRPPWTPLDSVGALRMLKRTSLLPGPGTLSCLLSTVPCMGNVLLSALRQMLVLPSYMHPWVCHGSVIPSTNFEPGLPGRWVH